MCKCLAKLCLDTIIGFGLNINTIILFTHVLSEDNVYQIHIFSQLLHMQMTKYKPFIIPPKQEMNSKSLADNSFKPNKWGP